MPSTVFLAEDDDDLRTTLASSLGDDGYDVVQARDGAELLELLGGSASVPWRRPDVIVTDLLMPLYSGLGVLAALKQSGWEVPVIVITAATDPRMTADALRLGAAAVLRKPFSLTDLRTAIIGAALPR
jgi:two-component system, response regulator, stage 0 sporulation protein F